MKHYIKPTALFFLFLLACVSAQAQAVEIEPMNGGSFTMTKSVIAGGGGKIQQNATNTDSTIGQTTAGLSLSGGQFQHYSGFWAATRSRTQNTAVVGGRVLNSEGNGIRNVQVTIELSNGERRTIATGVAGYYRFEEVPVGESFVVSVSAKRFVFSNRTQARMISGDTSNINFIAEPSPKTEE